MIDITNEDSSAVFNALRSETARSIMCEMDTPTTASELAEQIDSSIQNIGYHLQNLRSASLIVEVGTWYSTKGREMTVYAPASERVEIQFSEANEGPAGVQSD